MTDTDNLEPPAVPVEDTGEDLLADLRGWFGRYILTTEDDQLDLLALWTVHTHVSVECYTTGRLLIDSPVPESGKTTVLEHLNRLCARPIQAALLSSPAMLARMLEHETRTILIDEADRSLNPEHEGVGELIAILNSGYKRGATRPVLVPNRETKGWSVSEMPTFSPVVMAGNNPRLPDDTRSRAIRILLLPDNQGLVHESDWEMIEPEADALAQRVAVWADTIRDQIKTVRPPLPERITSRFREKWLPLRRVAEMAGGRWPEVADALAVQDRQQADMDRDDGLVREKPHVLLLRHLMEIWPEDEDFSSSDDLVNLLIQHHPDSWGAEGPLGRDLTVQRFGRMLANGFKINSDRKPGGGPRGHYRNRLASVWTRMQAPPGGTGTPPGGTGTCGTSGTTGTESVPDDPVVPHVPVHTGGGGEPERTECPSCTRPFSEPAPECSAAKWHARAA